MLINWNILRQFLNLSLPNLFIYSTWNILRQFLNLSLPNLFIHWTRIILRQFLTCPCQISSSPLQSQLTCSRFIHRMILLAPILNRKDTWPSGYKYPAHFHNIHSLATFHLLNSTKWNSSRPPSQFLTLLSWNFLSSLNNQNSNILKLPPKRPKEHELHPNSSTSVMVSVSLSFHY